MLLFISKIVHIHDKNKEQKEWSLIKQNIKKMHPKKKVQQYKIKILSPPNDKIIIDF